MYLIHGIVAIIALIGVVYGMWHVIAPKFDKADRMMDRRSGVDRRKQE